VHETRNFFARYLRIPESRVRVYARDVGGGFGQKGFVYREECAIVLASKLLGRPVKWIEDRRENLMGAPHSRNEFGIVRLAIDSDQTIEAITIEQVADVGAYTPCPAAIDATLLSGPYRIPRLGFSTALVYTNTMGKGAYRGPWMFETTAREMAIDHAARVLDLDPIELRRKNLLSATELPFSSPGGKIFKEITPLETFEQALAILEYDKFRADQQQARSAGRLLGLGCSVYVEPSAMGSPTLGSEGATVRVEASGNVVVYLGTTSHGQSVETTMAQIVADSLGVDFDDVTVIQGHSEGTPYGPATGGSRTAVIVGGATRQATEAVREQVLAVAAHKMEADPADLTIDEGRVSVKGTPAKAMTLRDVATVAYRYAHELPVDLAAGLEATVRFKPSSFPTWSNATHLCVVEIDPGSCLAKVIRYIVSEDCGNMINPRIVDGQICGGVIQGMGGVLLEDFVYDDAGNPVTTTLADYLLPTTTEVPDIEISHLESLSTTNPGGFKGLGEGGAIGSHAAVANAVADALFHLGIHVTKTPLGPKDIYRLLVEAGCA
jgi:carbon-monoxide dehydrogenase large subunit